ncbi:hypothetical protein ACQY0O_008269 [Thecaphora frezii]
MQPIAIGESLASLLSQVAAANADPKQRTQTQPPQLPSLFSFKYNFKPESVADSDRAILHNPSQHPSSPWQLEVAASSSSAAAPSRASSQSEPSAHPANEHASSSRAAHVFTGPQHSAKSLDCLLVWDPARKVYVLDRLASTMTLKFERSKTSLSDAAFDILSGNAPRSKRKRRPAEQEELDRGYASTNTYDCSSSSASASATQHSASRLSSATRVGSSARPSSDSSSTTIKPRRGVVSSSASSLAGAVGGSGRRVPIAAEVEEFPSSAPARSRREPEPEPEAGLSSQASVRGQERGGTPCARPDRTGSPPLQRPPAPKRQRSESIRQELVRAVKERRPPPASEAGTKEASPAPRPTAPQKRATPPPVPPAPVKQRPKEKEAAPSPVAEPPEGMEIDEGDAAIDDDLEAELAQALELDLERELDKLSDDDQSRPASLAMPSPPSPAPPTDTAHVQDSPIAQSSAQDLRTTPTMASPNVARFRLTRRPVARAHSEDSLQPTETLPKPATPAVDSPLKNFTPSPNVGDIQPASLALGSPAIHRHRSDSPMGLGLQSVSAAVTPSGSPFPEDAPGDGRDATVHAGAEAPEISETEPGAAAAAASAAIGWKPMRQPGSATRQPKYPSQDNDGESADDEDDEEGEDEDEDEEEEDEDDDDDDGLDDFAAELDLTLAESAAPSDDVAADDVASKSGPRKPPPPPLPLPEPPLRTALASHSQPGRKVYGLGGPREEEDDLEDSD